MQKWKYEHKDHPWRLQLRKLAATNYSCKIQIIIQPAWTSQPANRRQDGRPSPPHPAAFQRRAWWVTSNQSASNVKPIIERRCCESGCLLSLKYWLLAILYTSATDSAYPPPQFPFLLTSWMAVYFRPPEERQLRPFNHDSRKRLKAHAWWRRRQRGPWDHGRRASYAYD